jgi:hypothetical protein
MPILRSFNIKTVKMFGPAAGESSDVPSVADTFASAGNERIVAGIPNQAGCDGTFGLVSELGL